MEADRFVLKTQTRNQKQETRNKKQGTRIRNRLQSSAIFIYFIDLMNVELILKYF